MSMDRQHDFTEQADRDGADQAADDVAIEAPPVIGTDERRMHVRAYNYWVSLLEGRGSVQRADEISPEQREGRPVLPASNPLR